MKVYDDVYVPDEGPEDSPILVVGEAPGFDEYTFGRPFIGATREILDNCFSRHGAPRETLRLANLAHVRPWDNNFYNLVNTPFLRDGLAALHQYILTHRPVVIAALGNFPMHYLTGKGRWTKDGLSGIGNWRGSILPYVDHTGKVHEDIKVVPTYHPANVLRNRSNYPIFDVDIKRIVEESTFRGLNYRERNIVINPQGMELEKWVKYLCEQPIFAVDIETIRKSTHIISISFSPTPDLAVVIAPGTPVANRAIDRILRSPAKKVFHFGTFDTLVLRLNGFVIEQDSESKLLRRPYWADTYLMQHVLEPELPKTLAFLQSVLTREPYHKHEGKVDEDVKGWSKKQDKEQLFIYNGKDTCVDMEIYLELIKDLDELPENTRRIYDAEMSEITLQHHISIAGMPFDLERRNLFKDALIAKWVKLQVLLEGVVGEEVNVRSPKLKNILYYKEALGLPPRYEKKKITTNDDALVSLISFCQNKINTVVRDDTKRKWKIKLAVIKSIREIRSIRQMLSMYVLSELSEDGRSRSLYKNGPETGRWAASKFVDGTGYNHMTNPRDPIEVSDEEFEKYKAHTELLKEVEQELLEEELAEEVL